MDDDEHNEDVSMALALVILAAIATLAGCALWWMFS